MSKKKEREVIDFNDLGIKGGLNSQGRLTELLGECLEFDMSTLTEDEIKNRKVITIVVRYKDRTERRHTFSEVLIKQLKLARELYPNAIITGKIIKYKSYYQIIGCRE